jgi:(+)-abscisic acid 8'-hydroxylase
MVAWTAWAGLLVVMVGVVVALVVRRSRSKLQVRSPASKLPLPPGTLGLPWFGDTGLGLYLRHPAEWNTRKRAVYGDVFKARLFWRDTILLSLPLDNHWLLHVRLVEL